MNTSFSSINALATLLLLMGILLFNNGLAAWQSSQQVYSSRYFQNTEAIHSSPSIQQEYRQVMSSHALNIACSVFLIWLGLQVLFKKRWACHFIFSIRQVAQFCLVFLPLGTLLLSANYPLMDSMAELYQPIIQEIIQREYGRQAGQASNAVLNGEMVRMALQVALFLLAFLGMAIAGLILRLSSRCLAKEVQKALLEHSPYAGRFSRFILCLPMELLLVLLLSTYGTAKQLLEILAASLGGSGVESIVFRLGALACFALALLQLTNRNVQYSSNPLLKFQLMKRALFFCCLAYCMQLLQHGLAGVGSPQEDWATLSAQRDTTVLLAQSAIKGAVFQIQILNDVLILLMLGFLYYLLKWTINNVSQGLREFINSRLELGQAEPAAEQEQEVVVEERLPEQTQELKAHEAPKEHDREK